MSAKKDDLTMDFEDIIADDFRDDEFCVSYLNRVLEDYDPTLMLLAVRRIIKARGLKMTDIAKKSGLTRQAVY